MQNIQHGDAAYLARMGMGWDGRQAAAKANIISAEETRASGDDGL